MASPSPCRVGVQRLTQPGPGVQTEGWGLARGLACLPLSRSTQPSARRPAWLRRGRSRSSRGHRPQRSRLGGRRAGHDQRRRWRRARGGRGHARARCGRVGRGDRGPAPWRVTPHPIRRRAGRAESLQRTPSPQPPGGRVSAVSALSLLSSPCPSPHGTVRKQARRAPRRGEGRLPGSEAGLQPCRGVCSGNQTA